MGEAIVARFSKPRELVARFSKPSERSAGFTCAIRSANGPSGSVRARWKDSRSVFQTEGAKRGFHLCNPICQCPSGNVRARLKDSRSVFQTEGAKRGFHLCDPIGQCPSGNVGARLKDSRSVFQTERAKRGFHLCDTICQLPEQMRWGTFANFMATEDHFLLPQLGELSDYGSVFQTEGAKRRFHLCDTIGQCPSRNVRARLKDSRSVFQTEGAKRGFHQCDTICQCPSGSVRHVCEFYGTGGLFPSLPQLGELSDYGSVFQTEGAKRGFHLCDTIGQCPSGSVGARLRILWQRRIVSFAPSARRAERLWLGFPNRASEAQVSPVRSYRPMSERKRWGTLDNVSAPEDCLLRSLSSES